MYTFTVKTKQRDEMVEVTEQVQSYITKLGIQDGVAYVYTPHTTAGVAINENADPDVKHDVLLRLNEIFPWEHKLDRHMEGNTAAHLKAITTGTSQVIFVEKGKLILGVWQGIYLCEFDGPRTRKVLVKTVASNSGD